MEKFFLAEKEIDYSGIIMTGLMSGLNLIVIILELFLLFSVND